MLVNKPIPFDGTEEERKANFNTHCFVPEDVEGLDFRCSQCDCKPWHVAASFPCGEAEIPRHTVEVSDESRPPY